MERSALDYQVHRKPGKPTTVPKKPRTAGKAGSLTTRLSVSVAGATQTPGTSATQQDCIEGVGQVRGKGWGCGSPHFSTGSQTEVLQTLPLGVFWRL